MAQTFATKVGISRDRFGASRGSIGGVTAAHLEDGCLRYYCLPVTLLHACVWSWCGHVIFVFLVFPYKNSLPPTGGKMYQNRFLYVLFALWVAVVAECTQMKTDVWDLCWVGCLYVVLHRPLFRPVPATCKSRAKDMTQWHTDTNNIERHRLMTTIWWMLACDKGLTAGNSGTVVKMAIAFGYASVVWEDTGPGSGGSGVAGLDEMEVQQVLCWCERCWRGRWCVVMERRVEAWLYVQYLRYLVCRRVFFTTGNPSSRPSE